MTVLAPEDEPDSNESTKENYKMPKMSFNKEQLKGQQPVPGNTLYDVMFKDFKPKRTKDKTSINLNASMEIQSGPHKGRMLFEGMSEKAPWIHQDFCHAFGLPMEQQPDGSFSLPGEFVPDATDPNNVEKWKYKGPLSGRTAKVEAVVTTYQGKDQNKIKQYICKVEGCATKFPDVKHSTNLVK